MNGAPTQTVATSTDVPNASDSTKRIISVRFTRREPTSTGPLWMAETLDGPLVRVGATDLRSARHRMRARIADELGCRVRDIKFAQSFRFPPELDEAVRSYKRDIEQYRALKVRLLADRKPLAEALVKETLNQSAIAELLGLNLTIVTLLLRDNLDAVDIDDAAQ